MGYAILIITAILTQHIISWAGSTLNSVGNVERRYAVFTFSDDRNLPMTTNILMNIFMPNVILVFLFLLAKKWFPNIVNERLIIYTVSYYLYRLILICVILRRKELYSPKYELSLALVGTAISFALCKYYLLSAKTILLSSDEIRVELWLAIALIVYKFGKQVLDKKVTQNDILTKSQLEQYIIHKFVKFYKKYNDLLEITPESRYRYIFMFAVMIMEDFNRVPIVRLAENFITFLGKESTVGIMQVKSKTPFSEKKTIRPYIEWIKENAKDECDISDGSEEAIRNLAWKNNNLDSYAESVLYIYNCLYEYIDTIPKYRFAFHLRDTDNNGMDKADERKKGQMDVILWMRDNPNAAPEQAMQDFGLPE